jgi:hypothetical protein
MENRQFLDDWLRIHRQLVELEIAFAELALGAARGEVSLTELDARRAILMATRTLCAAAYERAFRRQ